MNGIRKLAFHAARYNRQKYLDSDVRSRPLQSVRRAFFSYRTVVILHRERPCLGSRSGGVFKLSIAVLRRGFFPSPDGSELYLCMPKNFSAYERCSLCEAGAAPKSRPFFKLYMDTNRKLTDITDKKPRTPSYKYSSRLNEEQHIRFNELLCKSVLEHNRSRFIVKRIFAEEFVVIKRDPSKTQFIARLNEFYFQFQKLANNCAPVKAI